MNFNFQAGGRTMDFGPSRNERIVDELRQQLRTADDKRNLAEAEFTTAEAEIGRLVQECDGLKQECDAGEARAEEARQSAEKATHAEGVAKDLYRKCLKDLQDLQEENNMDKQVDRLEAQILELKTRLANKQTEVENREADITGLEDTCQDLQTRLEAEEEAHEETRKDNTDKDKAIEDQELHVRRIEDQLQETIVEKERLEGLEKNRTRDLAHERANTRAVEDRLNALRTEFTDFQIASRGLQGQLISAEIDRKNQEIADKDARIATLEQEVQAAGNTNSDAIIEGLRRQLAGIEQDAQRRSNPEPDAYRDPGEVQPGDLNDELAGSPPGDDDSSSSSESESESESEPEPEREAANDNVRIVIQEVPGPVIREPYLITQIVRDTNPLRAWFSVERDVLILIINFVQWVYLHFVAWVRGVAFVDLNPIERPGQGGMGGIGQNLNLSRGMEAAPGGPAPGSDPNDQPPAPDNNPPFPDGFENWIPPLPAPVPGERLPRGDGPRNGNGNGNRNNNRLRMRQETRGAFWTLFNVANPTYSPTFLGALLHLVGYYFIYVCICTYFERAIWLDANDAARRTLLQLLGNRNRYSLSIWHYLFSQPWASRLDRLPLMAVQPFGVKFNTYPLPG